MQFHYRTRQDRQRIANPVAVMRPRTGVDQHGVLAVFERTVNALAHRPLAVRLERLHLHAKFGAQAFTEATLTNPEGVVGTDGLFRFRADGSNQRGLAVLQVGAGASSVISAAPRNFAPGT